MASTIETEPIRISHKTPEGARFRPKNPNPAQIAHDKKISELDQRIESIKKKLDDLRGVSSGTPGERDANNEIFEESRKQRDKVRAIEEERRRLFGDLKNAQEILKKKTGEASEAKKKLPFKTVGDIDRRIQEIDADLESGRHKLIEERHMINEITKLRKLRHQLESLDTSGNDVASIRLRIDNIRGKLNTKDSELEVAKAEQARISTKITEITGKRVDEKVQRADRNKLFTKLKEELDGAYEERRNTIEANKASKKALYEARLKRDARRAEAQRRQKIEEQIEELKEKLLAFNPETVYDKKVSECNNLVIYFQQFVSISDKQEKPVSTNGSLAAPVGREVKLGEELADAEVINKPSEYEEFYVPKSLKKKTASQKSSNCQHQVNFGKLPMHILAGLGDLSLSVPNSVEQIPKLFDEIEKKKTELESKKDEGREEMLSKHKVLCDEIEVLKKQLEEKPSTNSTNEEVEIKDAEN